MEKGNVERAYFPWRDISPKKLHFRGEKQSKDIDVNYDMPVKKPSSEYAGIKVRYGIVVVVIVVFIIVATRS